MDGLDILGVVPYLILWVGGLALVFLGRLFLLYWGASFCVRILKSFQGVKAREGIALERLNFRTRFAAWIISVLILGIISEFIQRYINNSGITTIFSYFAGNIFTNIILYLLFWKFSHDRNRRIIYFKELTLNQKVRRYFIFAIFDWGITFMSNYFIMVSGIQISSYFQWIGWGVLVLKLSIFGLIIYKWSFVSSTEGGVREEVEEEY